MSGQSTPPDRVPAGDYLWDGTGAVDEGVAELERVLSPLAHRGRLPRELAGGGASRSRGARWWMRLAAAAMLLLAVGAGLYLAMRAPSRGGWVETGPGGVASLHNGAIELGENTRAMLITVADGSVRLELERGSAHVRPGKDDAALRTGLMTAGVARVAPGTDALLVRAGGEGAGIAARIEVNAGMVEVEEKGRRVRLGRACVAEFDGRAWGTVRRMKASPAWADLVRKLDGVLAEGRQPTPSFIADVVKGAGPLDGPTLWNLMWRVGPDQRKMIVGRARVLWPAAAGLDEAVMRLDEGAMEKWWGVMAD